MTGMLISKLSGTALVAAALYSGSCTPDRVEGTTFRKVATAPPVEVPAEGGPSEKEETEVREWPGIVPFDSLSSSPAPMYVDEGVVALALLPSETKLRGHKLVHDWNHRGQNPRARASIVSLPADLGEWKGREVIVIHPGTDGETDFCRGKAGVIEAISEVDDSLVGDGVDSTDPQWIFSNGTKYIGAPLAAAVQSNEVEGGTSRREMVGPCAPVSGWAIKPGADQRFWRYREVGTAGDTSEGASAAKAGVLQQAFHAIRSSALYESERDRLKKREHQVLPKYLKAAGRLDEPRPSDRLWLLTHADRNLLLLDIERNYRLKPSAAPAELLQVEMTFLWYVPVLDADEWKLLYSGSGARFVRLRQVVGALSQGESYPSILFSGGATLQKVDEAYRWVFPTGTAQRPSLTDVDGR